MPFHNRVVLQHKGGDPLVVAPRHSPVAVGLRNGLGAGARLCLPHCHHSCLGGGCAYREGVGVWLGLARFGLSR